MYLIIQLFILSFIWFYSYTFFSINLCEVNHVWRCTSWIWSSCL